MSEKQREKYDEEREESGVEAPGFKIKKPVTIFVVCFQYTAMVIVSWVVSHDLILCHAAMCNADNQLFFIYSM